MSDAPVRLDATVHGRVQGVGFRYFAWSTAQGLGLLGWTANEPDGSVRCVAEGPRPVLDAFLAALEVGPASADVDRVVATWSPAIGGLGPFGIRSGAHRGD